MKRIGIVQRRQREAGSWVIDEEPLGEGDGWQDWPAFHRVATTDRGRIRFLVTPPGATATTRAKIRQVAEHEYRIMSRLANDRLLRPRDMVDSELGVGLVYPLDDRFQRLDLWLADHAGSVPAEDQLSLLRQVAEAVAYAHGNRVVHRGLTPHAVWVRPLPEGGRAGPGRGLAERGHGGGTGADRAVRQRGHRPDGRRRWRRARAADQPSVMMRPGAVDVDRRLAEAFQAPEGVWNRDADRIRLDVFALGRPGLLRAGRPPGRRRPRGAARAAAPGRRPGPGGRPAAGAVRGPGAGAGGDPARGQRAAAGRAVLPGTAGRRGTGRWPDPPRRSSTRWRPLPARSSTAGSGSSAASAPGPPPSACWSPT